MRDWIWREFAFRLPRDWEMLQFSRESGAGNCAFADRYQYRFELNWKAVPDEPDYDRMISDYINRLTTEQEMTGAKHLTHGPWHGFDGAVDRQWSSRYGRYFAEPGRLLELVFFWPVNVERRLLKDVLDSVRPLRADTYQRWQAFGMDLRSRAKLPLTNCQVQPALAQMTFADPGNPGCLDSFERLGMVDVWLQVPVRQWLEGKGPTDLLNAEYGTETIGDHEVETVTGEVPPLKFPKLGRANCSYRAAAWICPRDRRLYHVSEIITQKDAGKDRLAGNRLSCCPGMACA